MAQTNELASHIKDLRRLRDLAIATRKVGAAVTAECALGRALVAAKAVEDSPRTVYDMTDAELLEIASRAKEVRQ